MIEEKLKEIRAKANGEKTISAEELKELFINHELFSQFKENPTKLNVVIVEPGAMDLKLTNFSGLDIKPLNNAAFYDLQIEGLELKGGYVTSGGPDGVVVRYLYSPSTELQNKPKM